jgi:hypothetical protein
VSSGRPGPAWRQCVVAVIVLVLLTAPAALASDEASLAGRVQVSPIVVSLGLSATTALTGQTVKAQATASNVGAATIRPIVIELRVDPAGVQASKGPLQISQLKAGKSSTVSWSVCGQVPGSYVVLARATFDGVSIDSGAVLLTVAAGGRKACN